jgi:lipopolysaccharide biosynthesis protein
VPAPRALAFYLPQFYPTPENDEWWGPGFTEWTNVAQARPMFPGHHQPRIPGELGFYDLRNPETRAAQASLARSHGIHGFCYWHYWFGNGRRMLERPFDEVLASGAPDFPFCLAWANEDWTRIWEENPTEMLVRQEYPGPDDERRHFEYLCTAFHDPRYVRVDGRPLLLVVKPWGLPEPERFLDRWRAMACDAGLPGLFFVGLSKAGWRPSEHGFDGAVASRLVPPFRGRLAADPRAKRRADWLLSAASRRVPGVPAVYLYARWHRYIPELLDDGDASFPVVLPRWDNTPRHGRTGLVFHGETPELFGAQVRRAVELVRDRPTERQWIFVRSWNEWAEGNYLEPDRRWGRQFLEAFRDALRYASNDDAAMRRNRR